MAPVCVSPLSPSTRLARPKSVTCGSPLAVEQDVGRLEVAVQDAALVGVVHRPRAPLATSRRAPCRRRSRAIAARQLAEAAALDQLHAK